MHPIIYIHKFHISTYALMGVIGVAIANLLAYQSVKKTEKEDIGDMIYIEINALVGGVLGAKLLFLITVADRINWSRIFELEYFMMLMQGGFVFYGGLIGGVAAAFLAGPMWKVDAKHYIKKYIYFIPFCHGFGRVGCFFAGCCYGIPYEGPGAVVFPEWTQGLAGVSLFPVQLVEAALLMVISGIVYFSGKKGNEEYKIELYLVLYGILRMGMEYLRYDEIRGRFLFFTTSQWISIVMIVGAVISFIIRRKFAVKKKSSL